MIKIKTMQPMIKVGQILGLVLLGLAFSFLSLSISAHASGGDGGEGIGQGDVGAEEDFTRTSGGSWDEAGSTTTSGGTPPNTSKYQLLKRASCVNLGSCSGSHAAPDEWSGKKVHKLGGYTSTTTYTCVNTSDMRLIEAVYGFQFVFVPGFESDGVTPKESEDGWIAASVESECGYANWVKSAYKKCFYDATGSGTFSRNLTEIRDGGKVLVPDSTVLRGSPTSDQHENCSGSFYHTISVPTADYGYYRLFLTNKTVEWGRQALVYGGEEYDANWIRLGDGVQTKYGFYSFSCQADNPYNNFTVGLGLDSTYGSFKAGVDASKTDNFLDPAACPQTKGRWECTVESPTAIGLDWVALQKQGKTDASKLSASTMRNGDPVKLTYGQVAINDYNLNGDKTVVSEGKSGSVVKNMKNVAYRDSIVGRTKNVSAADGTPSTPWKPGSDLNASDQYYARYVDQGNKKMSKGTFDKSWGKWINKNANDNRDYLMSYNWASEKGAPFVTTREFRVTADFLVPSGADGGMDADGNFVSSGMKYDWKQDTRVCLQKTGSGSNKVETTNPVVSKSNKVDVLRATSKNE